jgi:type VI secretion system secreted protein VgrG
LKAGKNMKLLTKLGVFSLLLASTFVAPVASAATSPGLGAANTFTVLSSSYVNTTPGTTISADLGYTTGPATPPTVSGTTHVADSTYNQAGIDQGKALSFLNSQPCTFNFPAGPTDLATDATHGPVGIYNPGVYCITGSANTVSSGNITLDGAGTYIFRLDGALSTGANSNVSAINGASACSVWWTPTQATTLGANSTFLGTDIDASGITIGSTVTWEGQALAFGGTVSTDSDTLTSPTCAASRGNSPSAPTTTPGLPNTGAQMSARYMSPMIVVGLIALCALIALSILKKQRS